ncbi:MAG: hypothetical protein COA56_07915 [Dehalococcoidia bacterium]|nr:MAG: hypothetical protein COA56_07915 [Dehalococcoidia bacterium]PKB76954.1 MAG: hypothetical protein BZY85_01360 [SAR202 cluster bacterium MP-SAtl-SRR3965592-G1]HIM61140.1 hypothetical protein [Dehalococcoidia bacterium]
MNDQRKTKKQLLEELERERERSNALREVSKQVAGAHGASEGMDTGITEIAKAGAQSFALFIGFSILFGRLY